MKEKINLKYVLVILCITFIFPSIMYLISGKTIFEINSDFNFFYLSNNTEKLNIIGNILFYIIFLAINITYIFIIKNKNELFKDKNKIFVFIIIISMLFTIMLPNTSTDVFYYIGTGWSEAKYNVNPYKTSVEELISQNNMQDDKELDEMLFKTPAVWRDTVVVYGPICALICRILSGLSCGNLALALLIYKVFNLFLHIASCYLIYKLSNNKTKFLLLYGLNPFILFNGLTNVHNDTIVVFLMLLAICFLFKKKNIIATVFILAVATATKYYAVLIAPFLVIYYYRDRKLLKKLLYSLGLASIFIGVFIICYIPYIESFSVFSGVFAQQNKFANSIFLLLIYYAKLDISKIFMILYIIIYLVTVIILFFSKKKRRFFNLMRKYNLLLLIFIFGTITQFQTWYLLWVFPTIMWQNEKTINTIINLTISLEVANVVYGLLGSHFKNTIYYCVAFIIILTITKKIESINKNRKNIKGGFNIGKISSN